MGSLLAMRFAVCGFAVAEFCEARQGKAEGWRFRAGVCFFFGALGGPFEVEGERLVDWDRPRGNGQTRVASCRPGGKS